MSVSKLQRFGRTAPVGTSSNEIATTEFVGNAFKDVTNILTVEGTNLYTARTFSANLSNVGAGFTFQRRIDIPYQNQPILVRACFDNDTTGQFTVSYVAFAGGATTGFNPVNELGAAATWKTGVNVVVTPASANFSSDGINGSGTSEWMLINMPPRTDGKEYGSLYMRVYGSSAMRGQVGNGSRNLAVYGRTTGFKETDISEYGNGNQVSGNFTAFSPTNLNTQYYVGYYQVMAPKRTITIASCGDSTMQGLMTSGTARGWPKLVTESLSTTGTPVALQCWAYEGKSTPFFFGSINNGIITDQQRRPDILIIQPFSQNNTYSQANAEAAWAEFQKIVQTCYRYRVQPIVKTMEGTTAITTTGQESARLWINNAIKSSNIPYIDYTSQVSSGTYPDRLRNIYTSDGIHLNTLGNEVAAQVATETIRKFILI